METCKQLFGLTFLNKIILLYDEFITAANVIYYIIYTVQTTSRCTLLFCYILFAIWRIHACNVDVC